MSELNTVKKFKVPSPLTGHAFFFGRVGSGKTCKLLTTAQAYHSRGYKIFDIFGGKRGEGGFWCFPNDDKKLWSQFEHETHDFAKEGPKQYKVNLLFPMFSKEIPKRLPHNTPHIKSKIFTIPIKEIKEEDVPLVIGPLSNRSKNIWQNIVNLSAKHHNGYDVKHIMDNKFPKRKQEAIYTLFIKPLIDNHLISDKHCDLNLDIIEEMQDKETITVLILDYVPERYKFFIMHYILRQIFDAVMKKGVHKKNIALFREASLFMKVMDSDKSKEETTQIFRNRIVEMARYGRSGLFFFMDTQDSSECKGMIEGSDDFLGICEMPSPSSREITCEPLRKDRRINPSQIRYIATMPIHQICIITRGQRAKILKRIQPPRTKYWKSEYSNFIIHWKKQVDRWRKTDEDLDMMKRSYLKRKEHYDFLEEMNKNG